MIQGGPPQEYPLISPPQDNADQNHPNDNDKIERHGNIHRNS